jgi:serine/threonine protein phosphatase PrpC
MPSGEQTPSLALRAACLSDTGRVRKQNEDRCLVDLERTLFIVADGIGGQQAGEVASEAVVTVLPPMIEQHMARLNPRSARSIEDVLRSAILELSQNLRTESKGRLGLQGMGATVVLVWLRRGMAHLAHLGDSRIYLLRRGKLIRETEDHSVVAMLLRRKEITAEEARMHPARGRITRYVGMEGDVFADVRSIPLQHGDRFLLCSDGLSGMLTGEQIAHLLHTHTEPELACKALVEAANAAGGKDNITALVVNYGNISVSGLETAKFS